MAESQVRRTRGVEIVRAGAIGESMRNAGGRATAFDFDGVGSQATWLGMVALPAGGMTGPHHHGRHEVAVYVVEGAGRIRWGECLEFTADVGRGDFIYFSPYVPHQEINLDGARPLQFVVVRSDNERIAVDLDIAAL